MCSAHIRWILLSVSQNKALDHSLPPLEHCQCCGPASMQRSLSFFLHPPLQCNQSLSIPPPPPLPLIKAKLLHPLTLVPSHSLPASPFFTLGNSGRVTFLLVSYKCQLLLETVSLVLDLCLGVTSPPCPLSLMSPPQIKARGGTGEANLISSDQF